jgi:SAM-dependent methyltransferase
MVIMPRLAELTDLLWEWSPDGDRRPVRPDEVISRLAAAGQHRAARLVRRLPAAGGVLIEAEVDALMLRVHCELQRLGEELQLARRIAETLGPLVRDAGGAVRVVDIGCGLGYVIRWLAAHRALGPRVELVGVDTNRLLIARASALAATERLDCTFVAGDALTPGQVIDAGRATVMISSGLVHHLPADDLPGFFAAQHRLGVLAFAHWDVDPSPWSTLGAWVFHRGRMREAVSRHDGVLSARRAHPAATLLAAARAGAEAYHVSCADAPAWRPRLLHVLRPVVGIRHR